MVLVKQQVQQNGFFSMKADQHHVQISKQLIHCGEDRRKKYSNESHTISKRFGIMANENGKKIGNKNSETFFHSMPNRIDEIIHTKDNSTNYCLHTLVFSIFCNENKIYFWKKIVFKLRTFLKDEIFGGGPVFWLFFF